MTDDIHLGSPSRLLNFIAERHDFSEPHISQKLAGLLHCSRRTIELVYSDTPGPAKAALIGRIFLYTNLTREEIFRWGDIQTSVCSG